MKIQKFDVPFTQTPNSLHYDNKLSWKAKGIWAYIQSKPNDWDFSSDRMSQDSSDGLKATRSGLAELEKCGYLKRIRHADGSMDYTLVNPQCQNGTEPKKLGAKTGRIYKKEYNTNKEVNNKKEIAEASSAPWILEEKLVSMEKVDNSVNDIIATFIREKPIKIENAKQLSSVISRYGRVAKKLSGAYTTKQIFNAIEKIKEKNKIEERKGGMVVDYTLETIWKQLTK